MKLPKLSRLLAQDYPSQAKWIEQLLSPINAYFEFLNQALSKNLTITDNMLGTIKTVELDGTWPIKVAWELSQRPLTVLVGNVYRSDGVTFTLSSAAQVQWQYNQAGQLQLDGVTGVVPSSTAKYKVVLECKAG